MLPFSSIFLDFFPAFAASCSRHADSACGRSADGDRWGRAGSTVGCGRPAAWTCSLAHVLPGRWCPCSAGIAETAGGGWLIRGRCYHGTGDVGSYLCCRCLRHVPIVEIVNGTDGGSGDAAEGIRTPAVRASDRIWRYGRRDRWVALGRTPGQCAAAAAPLLIRAAAEIVISGRQLCRPPDAGAGGWRWGGHRSSVPLISAAGGMWRYVCRHRWVTLGRDRRCPSSRVWDVTLRVPAPVGDAGADTGAVCCRRCPSSRPCRAQGSWSLWGLRGDVTLRVPAPVGDAGHRSSVLPPLPLFSSVPRQGSWSLDASCAGLRWDVTLRVPAPVGDAGADTGAVCCRRCPSSRPCRGRRSWSQDACCAGLRWDVMLRVPAPVGDAGADTGAVCCRRCPSSRPCRDRDRDLWTPAVQASGGMWRYVCRRRWVTLGRTPEQCAAAAAPLLVRAAAGIVFSGRQLCRPPVGCDVTCAGTGGWRCDGRQDGVLPPLPLFSPNVTPTPPVFDSWRGRCRWWWA